ncbi:MAG TPA: hypothetical protein V6C81_06490 [Planktothrix sp.]|jgi:hypothetical protein
MKTLTERPHWPHTLDDITNSLDGIWGLVGATGVNGNLFRLERSLHEPLSYTLVEYRGEDERDIVRRQIYGPEQREDAVKEFAQSIGFELS